MPTVFCGGARVGESQLDAINYTCPFAKLEVGDQQCLLKIKCLMISKNILLKKEDIEKVEIVSVLFWRGIKLTHNSLRAPKYIVFWTFSPQKVYDFLLSQGYQNKLLSMP